ncbi:hypothetical protein CCACVL1_09717 [Corchorus capsularis]|uniref:Uncharacterized protein n=1 Tax=Corchorus capsularis TaxID=210143 RepID=A0A1R3IUH5_COCAP|nr:hypothetical protein CCACVL1_09717 [Corchorus capsularis]
MGINFKGQSQRQRPKAKRERAHAMPIRP